MWRGWPVSTSTTRSSSASPSSWEPCSSTASSKVFTTGYGMGPIMSMSGDGSASDVLLQHVAQGFGARPPLLVGRPLLEAAQKLVRQLASGPPAAVAEPVRQLGRPDDLARPSPLR